MLCQLGIPLPLTFSYLGPISYIPQCVMLYLVYAVARALMVLRLKMKIIYCQILGKFGHELMFSFHPICI